tara:strand:- start:568 stop:813 length:246 start_codon:yes stop_codon:yes gene_type:complete
MIDAPSKILLGLISACLATVSIQLIPLFKQASSWNRCLKKTSVSLSQIKAVMNIDDQSKEVLSVMICNGAVFEPKIKTKIQ